MIIDYPTKKFTQQQLKNLADDIENDLEGAAPFDHSPLTKCAGVKGLSCQGLNGHAFICVNRPTVECGVCYRHWDIKPVKKDTPKGVLKKVMISIWGTIADTYSNLDTLDISVPKLIRLSMDIQRRACELHGYGGLFGLDFKNPACHYADNDCRKCPVRWNSNDFDHSKLGKRTMQCTLFSSFYSEWLTYPCADLALLVLKYINSTWSKPRKGVDNG